MNTIKFVMTGQINMATVNILKIATKIMNEKLLSLTVDEKLI